MLRCWMPGRIALSLLLIVAFSVAEEDPDEIISNLQRKYNSIRDATVSFTQHVQFGVTKAEQTFKGKFLMKKGNKYRIEMDQQTIVTDGKSVWSFNKVNKQVLIDKFKDDPRSFTPDKVLVSVPAAYATTVLGTEKIGETPARHRSGGETTILKLVPKEKKANVQWMKVWVDTDEWLMKRIQVLDPSDNLTTYTISGITINAGIPESRFTFAPPQNVEVIDLR